MKKGKILSVILLFGVALLITGEVYGLHCLDFSDYYYVDLQGRFEDKNEFNDFKKIMQHYEIEFCMVDEKTSANGDVFVDIYCDDVVKEMLINQYQRYEGSIVSILRKTIKVSYHSFDNYLSENDSEQICMYLFSDQNLEKISFPFSDFEPERGGEGKDFAYIAIVRLVWTVTFGLILFFSICQCHYEKKEWFVKICYGYAPGRVLAASVGKELLSLLVPVILIHVIFNSCIEPDYEGKFIYVGLFVLILIDVFVIIGNFVFMNYKKALQKGYFSKKILKISYVLRVVLLTLSIVLLSMGMAEVKNCYKLIKQKEFYNEFKGYAHVSFEFYDCDINELMSLENQFYVDYVDQFNIKQWLAYAFLSTNASDDGSMDDGNWIIMASKNSFENVKSLLPDYANKVGSGEKYVFLPVDLTQKQKNDYEVFLEIWSDTDCVEVINYDDNISTVAFTGVGYDGEDGITAENPVIFLDMRDNFTNEEINGDGFRYYMYGSAMEISEKRLQELKQEIPGMTDYFYYDVYEGYEQRVMNAQTILMTYAILLVMIVALDIIVMKNIIKQEQEMNALEIALKKVMGSPIYDRYTKVINTTVTAGVLGVVLSIVLFYLIFETIQIENIILGLLFILPEMLLVISEARKWEKMQVQKILKGGSL